MSKRSPLELVIALAASALLRLPAATMAEPLVGHLTIGGAVAFSTAGTDFLPAGSGTGSVAVDAFTPTASFVGLVGTTGILVDWTPGGEPVGTSITVANFLTLAALPSAQFTLTFVEPGIYSSSGCAATPPAAGQTCTPPGTFLNLVNTSGSGSVAYWVVKGTLVNTLTSETSQFVGTFTTQFSGVPFQEILSTMGSGGSVSAAYSADLVASSAAANGDLAITKSDGLTEVAPGGTTTYTVVVTNLGAQLATAAPVTDTFPPAVTAATWTCVASVGSSCGSASGTGDIATTVTLLPGGTATFTATAMISSSATGALTNTASVGAGAGTVDPNLANNTASDTDALVVALVPTLDAVGALVLVVLLAAAGLTIKKYRSP